MTEISVMDNNYLLVRCDYNEKDKVKKTGGIFDKNLRAWLLPFTIHNVKYLIDNLTDVHVPEGFDSLCELTEKREKRLESIRRMAKADAPVKFKVPGLKKDLMNYQKLGVLFALTNPSGILLADMCGLGKTLQAIATASYKKQKEGIQKVLVITPASLKFNWPLEIKKFTDERCIVIDGTPQERLRQWNVEDVLFYITNFETIIEDLFGGKNYAPKDGDDEAKVEKKARLAEKANVRSQKLAHIRNRLWDMIVIDEIHSLKSHSSRRSQSCKKLFARYKMGLTGTPIDGKLEELHSIYEFITPGLFESKTAFLQKHAEFDFMGRIIKYREIPAVIDRIQPFFLRRKKDEVLKDLPPKIYQNRYVILSKEEKQIYEDIKKGAHELTENAQAMQTVLRCKQFCNHPALIGIETKTHSKLDSFTEILDELVVKNGAKVLVFSQYAKMCRILIDEVLEKMKLKYLYISGDTEKTRRATMQEEFNTDDKIDLMIGTDAMSTGLNFASAGYVINYDDFWSPSIMEQREDRAHRIGQKFTVNVINFITKDTVEERIRDVLYNKAKVSSQVLGDMTEEAVLKRLGPKDIAKLL